MSARTASSGARPGAGDIISVRHSTVPTKRLPCGSSGSSSYSTTRWATGGPPGCGAAGWPSRSEIFGRAGVVAVSRCAGVAGPRTSADDAAGDVADGVALPERERADQRDQQADAREPEDARLAAQRPRRAASAGRIPLPLRHGALSADLPDTCAWSSKPKLDTGPVAVVGRGPQILRLHARLDLLELVELRRAEATGAGGRLGARGGVMLGRWA